MATQQGSSATVRTEGQRDGLTIGLYLVVGVIGLLGYYLDRLPPGTVRSALLGKPSRLAVLAGILLAPVVLFAAFDFLRAQHRSYVPPSARVQVVRSIFYGGSLLVAQCLLAVSWRPALFDLAVRKQDLVLPLLGGAAIAYSAFAWALCFRRRTFVALALPSFQDAATALLDSYDFVLGRAGSDWKSGGGDPSWFLLPEFGMYANLYCLGGIGSGKTHTVVKPILEQALFKFPGGKRKVRYAGKEVTADDMKVGIFLLDAKGDNAEYVLKRAKAARREKDVVVLKPGGEWSYNPLAEGNPQALALKLVAALTVMSTQEPNSYYLKMQKEFATNAFGVLADVLGQGRFTMMELWRFICESDYQTRILDEAKPKNSISYRWFANQWAKEDPREQMMLTKGFRADLSQFVTDELAPTFCKVDSNFPGWRRILNEGKIVVFSMSLDQWGDFARAMGIFCLMDFQSVCLARTTPEFRGAGGNTDRLVMCFADEVWAYMNPKLAEFTAVSRQARCCTLALHQGLEQIPEVYRATMIGNFRTPIILGINDPLSTETFSKVFGTYKDVRRSRSESTGYSGVEKQLMTDNLNARAGGESRSVSVSESEVDTPRFTADEIQRQEKFRAIVQLFDGDVVNTPKSVALVPGHEALLG